jgi:hypothetical protein
MTDLQTFAFAFSVLWIGLAADLVRLHLLARRLQEQLRR